MSIFGRKRLLTDGERAPGRVTGVKRCWWIKVNRKPIRAHALDGAVFPHVISFVYSVQGREYQGKSYVSWSIPCPREGSAVTVCYDRNHPDKCVVKLS